MITRRMLLKIVAGTGLAAAASPLIGFRSAYAQGRPFVFVSWGGALSALEKEAFMDPASKEFGVNIVNTSPTNYAKLKAMVEGKSVEWDLVDVGGRFIFQGRDQGLLEEIDYKIVDASKLDKRWTTPYGVYTSTGGTVIAWNTNQFPASKGPTSWKDFWDVKTFPGPRGLYKQLYYNYEAALLAAGTKFDEVYPVTDEKVKLALAKLGEIKPHVKVWWSAGAQPPQLLSTGELAMSSAWTGRIIDIQKEKAPVAMTLKDGIAWGNAYVVPKGTPHRELAMRVINYCISEPAQLRLLSVGTYGPVLSSAAAKGTAEQRKLLVTAPENIKDMLVLNEEQAGLYSSKYEEAWNKFQLG
ncbi:MAG TPA: ABC transporter substrate-binding protein [Alphaproteobacteria bacterium]|nr:ABC transporter substrate-binding protein [Alphaproteobacteria bacterium]